MARKLASFTVAKDGTEARDLSHQEQARLAAAGDHTAECREDPNTGEYSVWDGAEIGPREGQSTEQPKAEQAQKDPASLSPSDVDRIADVVVRKLKG